MPLPEGLKYLQAGWWVVHVVTVFLVYVYAYRRGRRDERRFIQREREARKA